MNFEIDEVNSDFDGLSLEEVTDPQINVEEEKAPEVDELEGAAEEKLEGEEEKSEEVDENEEYSDPFKDETLDDDLGDKNDFVESLGIDGISTSAELKQHINELKSKGSEQDSIPSEMKTVLDDMRKVHEAGGDWKSVLITEDQIGKVEKDIALLEKRKSTIGDLMKSSEGKKNLILHYHKEADGMSAEDLAEIKEDLEDWAPGKLAMEASRVRTMMTGMIDGSIKDLSGKKTELSGKRNSLVSDSESNQKAARDVISSSIESYNDEYSPSLTKAVKKVAKKALSTDFTTVSLPKGFVETVLMEDGKISGSKLVKALAEFTYGDKRQSEILKQLKIKSFRELNGVGVKSKARSDNKAGVKLGEVNDFSGGIKV